MEAKELRINSIVEMKYKNERDVNNPHWEWNWVTPQDILDCLKFPDNYRPIPLTEEWLVKLGGKIIECYDVDEKKMFVLEIEFGEFRLRFNNGQYLVYHSVIRPIAKIEFVHTWQNLYFALTGQELTIKQ